MRLSGYQDIRMKVIRKTGYQEDRKSGYREIRKSGKRMTSPSP